MSCDRALKKFAIVYLSSCSWFFRRTSEKALEQRQESFAQERDPTELRGRLFEEPGKFATARRRPEVVS